MSTQLQLEYPVYGAAFQDDYHFIVAGGGGEGNNGIPNKVSRVKIGNGPDGKPTVKIIDELEYKGDSATGLVVNKEGSIVVGINDIANNIKNGENKHLRKFKVSGDEDKISFIKSVDIEHSTDPSIYQKAISSSKDGSVISVLSNRIEPSIVRIVDQDLSILKSIEVEDKEVKDIAVSPNGQQVAYITDHEVHVVNLETGEEFNYGKSPRNYSYSKIEFDTDCIIYIAVSLSSLKSSLLLQLEIVDGTELRFGKAKVITDRFSNITSLDILNSDLIAVAGNDNSIFIIAAEDFYVLKKLKNVHKFAITNIEFSPSGRYLLSSSAASTVNIYKIPSNIKSRLTWLYYSFYALILSIIYYTLKQNITPEQWNAVHEGIHYLFDEPMEMDEAGNISFIPYSEVSTTTTSLPETTIPIEQLSAAATTSEVMAIIETRLSSIEADTAETPISLAESVGVEVESAAPESAPIVEDEAIETLIETVKEIVIENNDIVKERVSSIAHTTDSFSSLSLETEVSESTVEIISPEQPIDTDQQQFQAEEDQEIIYETITVPGSTEIVEIEVPVEASSIEQEVVETIVVKEEKEEEEVVETVQEIKAEPTLEIVEATE